jgi:hypothetical protein
MESAWKRVITESSSMRSYSLSVSTLLIFCSCSGQPGEMPGPQNSTTRDAQNNLMSDRSVGSIAVQTVIRYVQTNKMESSVCFFFNVRRPSNTNRFFVYDLKNDSVLFAGLAAHGRCNRLWLPGRKYSNEIGSGCTSLGKYRVGASYHGQFGLAYKLHRLDSSNSNAYKRFVVLHAYDCVPESNNGLLELCQSNGCPIVSPGFMKRLDELLRTKKKPVLLWVMDE